MFLNHRTVVFLSIIIVATVGAGTAEALSYQSYVFGTYEMILFSYEDGTELAVYRYGNPVYSKVLDKGEHDRVFLSGVGAYEVAGSKKFSVLTGDAAFSICTGYYAMNQNGRGVSTEFYTYVPEKKGSYGSQKFIVFAYEDGTELTVEYADPNGVYRDVIADLPLDDAGYWETEDLSDKYVHVASNKPVSALSCYDMGYFVPSANGKFSGTRFYTYIGKTKYWGEYVPQDLVVIAYDDDTLVTIADSNEPGVIKWQGTLNHGQVQVQRFPDGLNEPVSVTSSRPVTVSVQQWVTNNEYSEYDDLFHGFFAPGRDGTGTGGLGRDILVPTHQAGYLLIMAYMDNTHVDVYNVETGFLSGTGTLYKGEIASFAGGNGLWRIVSDRPISAYTGIKSIHGFLSNAEFAPLLFDVTTGNMVRVGVWGSLAGNCAEPSDPNNNEIRYTLSYWSDPDDDTDVVITDYLPREIEFISADPCDNGFYDPNNHIYTWNIGTVTGGEPNSHCYLTVRVTGYAQPGAEIINKVELSSRSSYSTAEVSTLVCCPQEAIIYVKADAQGFRNGSSWADAYTTLQPALTRARWGCGSEIWVA